MLKHLLILLTTIRTQHYIGYKGRYYIGIKIPIGKKIHLVDQFLVLFYFNLVAFLGWRPI